MSLIFIISLFALVWIIWFFYPKRDSNINSSRLDILSESVENIEDYKDAEWKRNSLFCKK